MPSNKRQRELARRRAERQAARRAEERAKRRRRRTITGLTVGGVALAAVILLLALVVFRDDDKDKQAIDDPKASASATATPPAPVVACGGKTPPAPAKQTFKSEPAMSIDAKKKYSATLKTSCGPVSFELFADKAPHTVNSFAFLAGKKFYDGTFCHRMTNQPGLTVLQCGDPEGTGGGGPGYTLAEENLTGAKYPRGTVAMAKTNAPHSTGSQFFLVIKDTDLPPQYTVVGKLDAPSLTVLDKVLALGIEPEGQPDGAPKQRVYIESFAVTAK